MSERKLIDAEGALKVWEMYGGDEKFCEAFDALPAAVPVVDVEKAARKFHAIIHDAAPEEFPPEDEPLDNDEEAWLRQQSRAILEAGYVGCVSVEDMRLVATWVDVCGDGVTFDPTQPIHLGESVKQAAKRLLAAVEGK